MGKKNNILLFFTATASFLLLFFYSLTVESGKMNRERAIKCNKGPCGPNTFLHLSLFEKGYR